mmetsp:Transcript_20126/g.58864  ORF Transcript_20126/g.58864 Transcript_20126/m.58864 type:complete len:231 (-) Transcript_20126:125-817(-)
MRRIFGKPVEKPPPPSLGDASGRIDSRVSAIDEKIAKLDIELRKYKDQLKKVKGPTASNIKRRAMETLKRKKMYEQQRDQMAGQAFNIEQTAFAIDSIKDSQIAVEAMKDAAKTLKAEHKKLNLDAVEDLQDDLAEMHEDMEEINELMGRSYGLPDELDEADLDAELACLEDELEGIDEGEDAGVPSYLPTAPTAEVGGIGAAEEPAAAVPAAADGVDEFGLPMAPAGTN